MNITELNYQQFIFLIFKKNNSSCTLFDNHKLKVEFKGTVDVI